MYNVILVDDEIGELNALTKMTVWSKYNFNICASFTDASEAIEYINQNRVDAVFSDIAMSKMSGTEFLAEIRKHNPTLVFVFISAYSNFEYTHAAVVNNVFDYILKPINPTEFDVLCGRILGHLTNTSQNDEPNLTSMKCQQTLIDYFSNKININELKNIFENNGIDFMPEKSLMFILSVELDDFKQILEHWDYSIDRLYYAVWNILRNNEYFLIPLRLKANKITYLCITSTGESVSNSLEALSYQTNICESILKHKINYTIASDIAKLDDLGKSIEKFIMNTKNIGSYESTMESAIEYIEKNYINDISLSQIAEHLSLSIYHTSHMFKKHIGESFIDYLNSFRITKAKSMLITTSMTMTAIAEQTGFGNKRRFYRTFQNFVGCTPSEYRNKFLM